MKEIEILVELYTDLASAKLQLSSFEYKGAKETIDQYFYDPLRENLKLNKDNKLLECCRLRSKNNKNYFTYKIDIYDEKIWKYSEEFEIEFSDAYAMSNILKNLGLEHLITIDNIKHTFTNEKYEIVLEEVKELGNFLEVEYIAINESKSIDDIKSEIMSLIHSLNLSVGPELNSGKPELLLIKSKNDKF